MRSPYVTVTPEGCLQILEEDGSVSIMDARTQEETDFDEAMKEIEEICMSKREFKIGDLVSSTYGPGGRKIAKAIIIAIDRCLGTTYTLQIQSGERGWEDPRRPGKRHWNVNECHLKLLGPLRENNQYLLDF